MARCLCPHRCQLDRMQEFSDFVQHACAVWLGSGPAAFYEPLQRVRKLLQSQCAPADSHPRRARLDDGPSGSPTRRLDQREDDIQHERQWRLAAVWQNGQHGGDAEDLGGRSRCIRRPARLVSGWDECDEECLLAGHPLGLVVAVRRDAGE